METMNLSAPVIAIAVVLISAYIYPALRHYNVYHRITTWYAKRNEQFYTCEFAESDESILKKVTQFSLKWWTDNDIFQLERRAIFSKTWHFVAHASRFRKPGDYRTYEIAGFSFMLILGKDQKIRAFHNICRHRAYTITKKESGSSTVLGCRYHGWSYNTKGELVKAPEFDKVEGFQKEMNSLWEIRSVVKESMVFVNLDAGPEVSDLELAAELKARNTAGLDWVSSWKFDAVLNWKLAAGEFSLERLQDSQNSWQWMLGRSAKTKEMKLSYSASIWIPHGLLLTVRLLPQSPSATTIECDLHAKITHSAKFSSLQKQLKEEIQSEIGRLEIKQRDLSRGNDDFAVAPQEQISQLLRAHLESERQVGHEIEPAARKQGFSVEGKADDDLCAELESNLVCKANNNGLLDW
ncbi:hypothetical protein BP6252_11441 [Coleophoma cylindrospora]|uniref:Rieske domain-containing protein n=1 Tax=Coleophoma cylindrospora TaxID=1849047 RepID=A0A3D8QJW3_9HELO|nr:hypothetical protein BP6252_11441 [Coleophoma cylindrospora]